MPLLRSLQHSLWRGGVFVLFLLLLFPHAHALSLVEVQRQAQNEVLGLDGVAAVAVSPDGQHLYAASVVSSAVAVFSRDVNRCLVGLSENCWIRLHLCDIWGFH
ncbi:hypothetical protein [Thioflexithrix psekupsensis]|uniref:Uncharacterized protein n=1 Tax=Thioflexithrix psekupsensis TaxID=1570016 RepID=A0A251X8S1_9GAMM|nr:hypothetical protein [Thioflexithrix psekupsensis]OUD14371.1 hypothetical protein TPSD3_08630 [Thioflexithrix psekupsensis]